MHPCLKNYLLSLLGTGSFEQPSFLWRSPNPLSSALIVEIVAEVADMVVDTVVIVVVDTAIVVVDFDTE